MISLRTKDDVTMAVSRRLFAAADTPEAVRALPEQRIAELIYPAGFYRTKAGHIKSVAAIITDDYDGRVPDTVDELTRFPGVGRKTANLVLNLGFGIPAICVDTHVHRIANRFGWVSTQTPDQTESALMEIVPRKHWIATNELLVAFGQNVCTPLSPRCSECPFFQPSAGPSCAQNGVERSR
jgi:endonuclease-3